MNKAVIAILAGLALLTVPMAYASHTTNTVYVKDYSLSKYNDPVGKINIRTSIYKLENDRTNTYDWYEFYIQHQSIPGYSAYDSTYKNYYMWTDYRYKSSPTILWDYDPTGTITTSSASVSLSGGQSASVAASWSYTTSSVTVYDYSDYSVEKARWKHSIQDRYSPAAESTYKANPGAMFRTADDQYVKVVADHNSCFKSYQINNTYCVGYLYDYMSARMLGDPT